MKNNFYKTGDYIHLGLTVLMTGLSIWGAVAGPMLVMKVISIAVAVAAVGSFLILTLAFRLPEWKSRASFVPLNYGVSYRAELESSRVLSKGLLNKWLDELIDFWVHEKEIYPVELVLRALNGTTLTFKDLTFIDYGTGQKASALTYPDAKVIVVASYPKNTSTPDVARMRSLVRHEGSHIVACACGGLCDTESSHNLFQQLGLGA